RRGQKKKAYHCTRCEGEIGANEVQGSYVKGELICPGCRATDEVADRRAEREKATGDKKAACEALITDHRDPAKARRAALGYGALFFAGVTGPLLSATSMRGGAFAIGLAVALVGAITVY